MDLSLNIGRFLAMLAEYNLAIWPMQVVAYIMGIVAIILALKKTTYSSKIIAGILAFFWLWTAILFNYAYFSQIYEPANIFAVAFLIQGILFIVFGLFGQKITFSYRPNVYSTMGIVFILFSMIGYPLWGYLIGHIYPRILSFGLTACPLVVFTFGMLLLTDKKMPKYLLIIPIIWTLSSVVPITAGILEDVLLAIAGILGTILILVRDKKSK